MSSTRCPESNDLAPQTKLGMFRHCISPYAQKSAAGKERRRSGWEALDPNGNGIVSLAELDRWIMQECEVGLGKRQGHEVWEYFRPSYIRAFKDAKDVHMEGGDDYVTKLEFRTCAAYLCVYAAMTDCFLLVEGGGDGLGGIKSDGEVGVRDHRISLEEWRASFPSFRYGYDGYSFAAFADLAKEDSRTADSTFLEMDLDGHGCVVLSEWCEFIKMAEIKSNSEIGAIFSRPIGPTKSSTRNSTRQSVLSHADSSTDAGSSVGSSALVAFRKIFAPYAEKTPQGLSRRKLAWSRLAPDGVRGVSLAQLKKWVSRELQRKYTKAEGRRILERLSPCCELAFEGAKDIDGDGDDNTVEKKEFRLFACYLCIYAEMVDCFLSIVKDDGQNMSPEEWGAAFPRFYNGTDGYNFAAFADLAKGGSLTAEEIFAKMDTCLMGSVALSEWCDYLKRAEIEHGTESGSALSYCKN
mmetsp:Transcript_15263/g.30418  ORF Transcript_15263/g.30418 Transcript_15263/m.30418 type:complete len:467 (+) Transcript_15263:176-1576(+)